MCTTPVTHLPARDPAIPPATSSESIDFATNVASDLFVVSANCPTLASGMATAHLRNAEYVTATANRPTLAPVSTVVSKP